MRLGTMLNLLTGPAGIEPATPGFGDADTGGTPVPRLAIIGANCMSRTPWDMPRVPWGYTCLAWHGTAVIAYHPRNVDPAREWSGTVAVVRGDRP